MEMNKPLFSVNDEFPAESRSDCRFISGKLVGKGKAKSIMEMCKTKLS
jgi:hypothetical protein